MTTTTTTEKKEKPKVDLSAFLDTQALTRAENSYYLKQNKAKYENQQKTIDEWLKVIKIIK